MIDHDELLTTSRTLAIWTVMLLVAGGFALGFIARSLL